MALRALDACSIPPNNDCLRVCIQNTIMSLERVLANLQGIVSDIGILVRKIEDVTDKIEQRNSKFSTLGDSEWKQGIMKTDEFPKRLDNFNMVTKKILSSKSTARSSDKGIPCWTTFNGYLPSLQARIVNGAKEGNESLSTVSSGSDVTFDDRYSGCSELCSSFDWRGCNYKHDAEKEHILPKVLSRISEINTKTEGSLKTLCVDCSSFSSYCDIYEKKMEQELESLLNYYTDESDSDRDCEDYWSNDVGLEFESKSNSSVSSIPYSEELVIRYNKDISTWTAYKFVHLSDSDSISGAEAFNFRNLDVEKLYNYPVQ